MRFDFSRSTFPKGLLAFGALFIGSGLFVSEAQAVEVKPAQATASNNSISSEGAIKSTIKSTIAAVQKSPAVPMSANETVALGAFSSGSVAAKFGIGVFEPEFALTIAPKRSASDSIVVTQTLPTTTPISSNKTGSQPEFSVRASSTTLKKYRDCKSAKACSNAPEFVAQTLNSDTSISPQAQQIPTHSLPPAASNSPLPPPPPSYPAGLSTHPIPSYPSGYPASALPPLSPGYVPAVPSPPNYLPGLTSSYANSAPGYVSYPLVSPGYPTHYPSYSANPLPAPLYAPSGFVSGYPAGFPTNSPTGTPIGYLVPYPSYVTNYPPGATIGYPGYPPVYPTSPLPTPSSYPSGVPFVYPVPYPGYVTSYPPNFPLGYPIPYPSGLSANPYPPPASYPPNFLPGYLKSCTFPNKPG